LNPKRPVRDPELGPSCDGVLDRPTESQDSSDRHSQREDHDWKHDEDKHPESRQHVRTSPALLRGSHPVPRRRPRRLRLCGPLLKI